MADENARVPALTMIASRAVALPMAPEATRIRHPNAPPARWARPAEIGLLLGLGVLALATRLPSYQLIPAFTDETGEIRRALAIARGEVLPLTNVDPYMGALWNYLVAAALLVSDFSLYAPRTVTLVLGVLTVAAAYPLGRAWGGRVGGLVAAALLATAPVHIAVNSHVAWSNSMTPLFTTIGVLALWRAVRDRERSHPSMLPLAGLAWGLALHSHPSVLALLPGAAAFLLWRGRPLLRSRRLWLAVGLFVLANLNLLTYNLATGFDSIAGGMDKAAEYADGEELTWRVYRARVGLLLLGLFESLGGQVDLQVGGPAALLDPTLWPIALLAAAGVAWQWRRDNPLPALLLAGAVLILPIVNAKYDPIPSGRYLMPLLPVLFAGIGSVVAAALDRLGRAAPTAGTPPTWFRLGLGLLGAATAVLVLVPLLHLRTYYRQVPEIGWSNAPLFPTVGRIVADRRPDEPIILDRQLRIHRTGWGGGTPLDAFELALELRGIPYRVAALTRDNTDKLLAPDSRCGDQLVVVALSHPQREPETVARLGLQPVVGRPPDGYPLYRLPRSTEAGPTCHQSPTPDP